MYNFFLSSHLRSIFVSVLFDFNASLNDVAPVFPMLFPVHLMSGKSVFFGERKLCIVSFVFTIQIDFCECCV